MCIEVGKLALFRRGAFEDLADDFAGLHFVLWKNEEGFARCASVAAHVNAIFTEGGEEQIRHFGRRAGPDFDSGVFRKPIVRIPASVRKRSFQADFLFGFGGALGLARPRAKRAA